MSVDLVFEPPPPEPTKTNNRVSVRLEPLKDRPGDWARVYESVYKANCYTFSRRLREGHHAGVVAGDFETRVGTVDGRHYVWARYVGSPNGNGTED